MPRSSIRAGPQEVQQSQDQIARCTAGRRGGHSRQQTCSTARMRCASAGNNSRGQYLLQNGCQAPALQPAEAPHQHTRLLLPRSARSCQVLTARVTMAIALEVITCLCNERAYNYHGVLADVQDDFQALFDKLIAHRFPTRVGMPGLQAQMDLK